MKVSFVFLSARETFSTIIFVGEYKIVVHPYLNKFRGKNTTY
jgi:hypothetical protein